MSEEKYRVVFEGRVAEGQDLNLVKKRLASIFKTDIKNVEKMFKGRTVIKKNVPLETCKKVKQAFGKAGAICKIVPEETISFDINDVEPEEEKPARAPKKTRVAGETPTEERPPYLALVVFTALVIAASFGNLGFVLGVACIGAIWVYIDATKRNIGRTPGEKGLLNMSAGSWAFGTFLIWIVIFPLYVFKRPKLERKAKQTPVTSSKFKRVAALSFMGIVTCFFFFRGVVLIVQNQGAGQPQGYASVEQPGIETAPASQPPTDPLKPSKREGVVTGKVRLISEAKMLWYYIDDFLVGAVWETPEKAKAKLDFAEKNDLAVRIEGVIKTYSDGGKSLRLEDPHWVDIIGSTSENVSASRCCNPAEGEAFPFLEQYEYRRASLRLKEYTDPAKFTAITAGCQDDAQGNNFDCSIKGACEIARWFSNAGYSFDKTFQVVFSSEENATIAQQRGLFDLFMPVTPMLKTKEGTEIVVNSGVLTWETMRVAQELFDKS